MNIFPENLLRNALNLNSIGISDLAWRDEFIFNSLDFLKSKDYMILGGDVYQIDEETGVIIPTGDNWYYNKNYNKSDVPASYQKAHEYINNYKKRNGSKYFYSLIYTK